ncbi:MAG: hypothetical protein EOO63_05970, partial [Hymenobacter sp.]
MDYVNANNYAVSPCQLDIMHGQLNNPANPSSDYHLYLTRSACDEVPPRAFFTIASIFANPASVWMDGRGTYAADGWQLKLYRMVPGYGPVLVGTYTKHGGLGQRLNLATVFNFSNGGDYRLDMKAVKQSGQFHMYRQSFTVTLPPTTNPPPCNDCEPRPRCQMGWLPPRRSPQQLLPPLALNLLHGMKKLFCFISSWALLAVGTNPAAQAQTTPAYDWSWATQLGPSAGSNRTAFVHGLAADAAGNVTIGGEFDPNLYFANEATILQTNRQPDVFGYTGVNGFLAQYQP